MKTKSVILKSLFLVFVLISILVSIMATFSLLGFVLNPTEKEVLHVFIGSLVTSAILWGCTFYFSSLDKNKTRKEKIEEIKIILVKMPLILLSSFLTSIYVLIYFFFFSFLTVSDYGNGGLGGDTTSNILITIFIVLAVFLFGIVMYKVFKTDNSDISLTLFNQFSVLKWSSLVALPFGLWSSYYFYHSEETIGWVAMAIWGLIFYAFYKVFDRLADKVQNHITNANVNRIIHEKKKNIIKKAHVDPPKPIIDNHRMSVADELKKFKDLLNDGVITQDEFDHEKRKLLNND